MRTKESITIKLAVLIKRIIRGYTWNKCEKAISNFLIKVYAGVHTVFFRIRIRKCKAAYGLGGNVFEGRHTRAPWSLKGAVEFIYPTSDPKRKSSIIYRIRHVTFFRATKEHAQWLSKLSFDTFTSFLHSVYRKV